MDFKWFIVLWIFYAICVLCAVAGVVYIASHFLAKVW